MTTLPFFRRPVTALVIGTEHVVRLDATPTRTGVRVRRVDSEPAGESAAVALGRLGRRWGRASRYVVTHLAPGALRHRIETLPELDSDEMEAYVAQRLRMLVPATEAARFATGHAVLSGEPARLLLYAAERAALAETWQAVRAAGLVPLSVVSVLPALGYAWASDPAFAGQSLGIAWEGAGTVRYAGGHPVSIRDGGCNDDAGEGETVVLAESPPLADEAPEGSALFTPALALAMLARFPALPRAELLPAAAREAAAVALDRRDATRVLAALLAAVLLVAGSLAWRLDEGATRVERTRARVAALRPGPEALERAEASLGNSEARAGEARASAALAPLLDAVGRRVPSGIRLTAVQVASDSLRRTRVTVAGMAARETLVPAYLDALGADSVLGAPRLRFIAAAQAPGKSPRFELVIDGEPSPRRP